MTAHDFTDIEDLPDPIRPAERHDSGIYWFVDAETRERRQREQREFEEQAQFHTIQATVGGQVRVLRLSYIWLTDHNPEEVRRWLDDHDVGRSLSETDRIEASILDQGTIRWR